MMEFTKLVENVKEWSADKGLDKADALKQMQKLNEEWGELNAGKAKGKPDEVKDSIGDALVVLTILSQQMNFQKIERLVNPVANGFGRYEPNEIMTDVLILYGNKEIGLISQNMLDLIHNPGIINARTKIQLHIRNLAGVLYQLALNERTNLTDCLAIAWNEIKNRQGKMIDGVFVKNEDIKEATDDK